MVRLLSVRTESFVDVSVWPPRQMELKLLSLKAQEVTSDNNVTQLAVYVGDRTTYSFFKTKELTRWIVLADKPVELWFSFTSDSGAFQLTGVVHGGNFISCYTSRDEAEAAVVYGVIG